MLVNNVIAKFLMEDINSGEVSIWAQAGPVHEREIKYRWFSRIRPDGTIEKRFGSGKTLNEAIYKSRK